MPLLQQTRRRIDKQRSNAQRMDLRVFSNQTFISHPEKRLTNFTYSVECCSGEKKTKHLHDQLAAPSGEEAA